MSYPFEPIVPHAEGLHMRQEHELLAHEIYERAISAYGLGPIDAPPADSSVYMMERQARLILLNSIADMARTVTSDGQDPAVLMGIQAYHDGVRDLTIYRRFN